MAVEKDTKSWFHEGRGSVSAKLAKSNGQVVNSDATIIDSGMEAVPTDSGAKAIYATGETPFHHGAGSGRGSDK